MFRPIDRALTFPGNPAISVTRAEDDDDSWVQTAAEGWSDYPELAAFVLESVERLLLAGVLGETAKFLRGWTFALALTHERYA